MERSEKAKRHWLYGKRMPPPSFPIKGRKKEKETKPFFLFPFFPAAPTITLTTLTHSNNSNPNLKIPFLT